MSYVPLEQEDGGFEAAPAVVAPAKRTRKKRAAAKGRSTAAIIGIVLLVLLALAVVVCAIALPIVFTRKTQQNAGRFSNLAKNSGAATGGTASAQPAPQGAVIATIGGTPNSGELVPSLAGGNAGVPDAVANAAVGPDANVGGNVFCYLGKDGNALPGAFTLTGQKSKEDGLDRSEVRSCGSGSKMYLLTSRLTVCSNECKEPAWMAIAQGMVNAPIWTQQYVCRGDQVYINRLTPRYTFYLRYAGYVQEQLITRCDSNDAFWVPNIELRFCQPQEISACQVQSLNPSVPKGPPKIVEGVPAGVSSVPRPVCRHTSDNKLLPFFATGVAANSWSWSRFTFLDKLEVTSCANRGGEKTWIAVEDMVPCPADTSASCAAGKA